MEDAKNIEMFAERQLFLLPLLLITTWLLVFYFYSLIIWMF